MQFTFTKTTIPNNGPRSVMISFMGKWTQYHESKRGIIWAEVHKRTDGKHTINV